MGECTKECGGKPGWCDFCGGKNVGACCKRGDGGVCNMFVVPVAWYGGVYQNCVHTDCIQTNTGYYGKRLKKFRSDVEPYEPEECRELCQGVSVEETDKDNKTTVVKAVAFTLNDDSHKCNCLAAERLNGQHEEKAF